MLLRIKKNFTTVALSAFTMSAGHGISGAQYREQHDFLKIPADSHPAKVNPTCSVIESEGVLSSEYNRLTLCFRYKLVVENCVFTLSTY